MMHKSLETVLKALEQDALAFCSESDWAIVVAECERAGNVRRVSKSAQVILEKAMTRSEAGRFAAQQRWKNHVSSNNGPTDKTTYKGSKYSGDERNTSDESRKWKFSTDIPRQLDMESNNARLESWTTDKKVPDPSGDGYWTKGDWNSDDPDYYRESDSEGVSGKAPKPTERGSGSFDDGTPFTGKFSSPADLPKYKKELKAAALYQIHGEITKMHRDAGKKIPAPAKPYMDALNSLSSVKDQYGMDSGKSIVAYTISNLKFFGDMGKALKAELSARLK